MDGNDRNIPLRPINIVHLNSSENIDKAEVQIGRSIVLNPKIKENDNNQNNTWNMDTKKKSKKKKFKKTLEGRRSIG